MGQRATELDTEGIPYQCPRLHGELTCIATESISTQTDKAYFCEHCSGVFLHAPDWGPRLNIASHLTRKHLHPPLLGMGCSRCQEILHFHFIDEQIPVFYCAKCRAYWMDQGIFALLMQRRDILNTHEIQKTSPYQPLSLTCDDCGVPIEELEKAHPSPIGVSCDKCIQNPPLLSDNRQQSTQMITFLGMEIKIDHWDNAASRIVVTPVQPSLLNVRFYSLSLQKRILRMGYRKLPFSGTLGKRVDATQEASLKTPLRVFLLQRGVVTMLEQLCKLGKIELDLRPHNFSFMLKLARPHNELRQSFESTTRRLLIAYQRYVELTERYI